MSAATSGKYTGTAAAILAPLLWGSAYIAMKFALECFHPMVMTFLVQGIAAIIFLAILPLSLRFQHYAKGDWRIFALLFICEPCLYYIFEGYALINTSAAQAGMITATLPVFVGTLGYFLLKEKLSRTAWLGCIIAMVGAIMLSAGAVVDGHAPHPVFGNILQICAIFFAAMYAICVRRLSSNYTPLCITAVQSLAGALFFSPSLFLPGMGLPESASMLSWGSIVFIGVGVSAGAYWLYGIAISRLGASMASVYMNLLPVSTLFFSMAILGEKLTAGQWAASALVLLGVLISQKK
jgi:drug/metabolite transporter (DMT)-like permease